MLRLRAPMSFFHALALVDKLSFKAFNVNHVADFQLNASYSFGSDLHKHSRITQSNQHEHRFFKPFCVLLLVVMLPLVQQKSKTNPFTTKSDVNGINKTV